MSSTFESLRWKLAKALMWVFIILTPAALSFVIGWLVKTSVEHSDTNLYLAISCVIIVNLYFFIFLFLVFKKSKAKSLIKQAKNLVF